MFFPGLLQHCAMPNKAAEGSRTGILIQMLPKFVRPMEDLKASISPEVVQGLPKVQAQSDSLRFSFIHVNHLHFIAECEEDAPVGLPVPGRDGQGGGAKQGGRQQQKLSRNVFHFYNQGSFRNGRRDERGFELT